MKILMTCAKITPIKCTECTSFRDVSIFYRESLAGSAPVKTFPSNFSILANEMRSVVRRRFSGWWAFTCPEKPINHLSKHEITWGTCCRKRICRILSPINNGGWKTRLFWDIFCRCGFFISWRCNLLPSTLIFTHLVEFSDRVDKRIKMIHSRRSLRESEKKPALALANESTQT